MSAQVNWKGVLFYLLIAVAVCLVILYFVYPDWKLAVNGLAAKVTGAFAGLSLPQIDLNSIFQWIQANPLATTVFGFLGTTAVGYVIKNWQTNKLLNQAVDAKVEAEAQIAMAKSDAAKYADSLKMYQEDTTATELQKSLDGFKSEYSSVLQVKDAQYLEAQKTIKSLQEQIDARPVIKISEPT